MYIQTTPTPENNIEETLDTKKKEVKTKTTIKKPEEKPTEPEQKPQEPEPKAKEPEQKAKPAEAKLKPAEAKPEPTEAKPQTTESKAAKPDIKAPEIVEPSETKLKRTPAKVYTKIILILLTHSRSLSLYSISLSSCWPCSLLGT